MDKIHFCRELTAEEVLDIYSSIAPLHFPKAELKPVENVKKYLENDLYTGYGFYENETLLAYALFLTLPKNRKLLLDYYAVLEEYRNGGIGSAFLQSLRTELTCADGIYIESENPDYAENEQERKIQEKRIDFYDRNGAVFTGILSTLFGVPYRVLYLPLPKIKNQNTSFGSDMAAERINFYHEIDLIYRAMFAPDIYARKVKLERSQGVKS